jgi:hypothetical protein
LTEDESDLSTIESVLRMRTRADLQSKLGKPIYSFTLYEKVKRATILLDNDEYPLLMVSFNIETDHESLIKNKLIATSEKMDRINNFARANPGSRPYRRINQLQNLKNNLTKDRTKSNQVLVKQFLFYGMAIRKDLMKY